MINRHYAVVARIVVVLLVVAVTVPGSLWAASPETLDLEMLTRIRQEGFRRSQVMQTLSEITDRIGPRVTGSTQMKEANNWAKDKLNEWGLINAHLESYGPFGRAGRRSLRPCAWWRRK